MCGHVLASDLDAFRRDLKLIQQRKPLSTKQVKLVQSYIAKFRDKEKRKEFNDVLFGRDNVSAHDYNLSTPPMDPSALVSLATCMQGHQGGGGRVEFCPGSPWF